MSGAGRREYGRSDLAVEEPRASFDGFTPNESMTVWMSHGDHVDAPPPGYVVTASSGSVPIAAMRHSEKPIYCVQFHPEVAHTPRGGELISNFLFRRLPCAAELDTGRVRRERGREDSRRWSARRG